MLVLVNTEYFRISISIETADGGRVPFDFRVKALLWGFVLRSEWLHSRSCLATPVWGFGTLSGDSTTFSELNTVKGSSSNGEAWCSFTYVYEEIYTAAFLSSYMIHISLATAVTSPGRESPIEIVQYNQCFRHVCGQYLRL